VELPPYMSMKFNNGVRISPMKAPNKRFIPISNPGVTSNLLHGDLERESQGFYLEGQKAFFMRDITRDEIKKVLLRIVMAAPESLGIDDPLPLLPENIGRIKDLVKARVQNKVANDRLNDNNPNPRVTNG